MAGGLIGVAVDSATGADNRCETPVNVTRVPLQPGNHQMTELPQHFDATSPPRRGPHGRQPRGTAAQLTGRQRAGQKDSSFSEEKEAKRLCP